VRGIRAQLLRSSDVTSISEHSGTQKTTHQCTAVRGPGSHAHLAVAQEFGCTKDFSTKGNATIHGRSHSNNDADSHSKRKNNSGDAGSQRKRAAGEPEVFATPEETIPSAAVATPVEASVHGEAYIPSFMVLDTSDEELLSPYQTAEQITASVLRVLPALSPSCKDITRLRESVQMYVETTAPPLRLPEICESPTTWPSINATMDAL
jgi:hypothetical protein